ncbi:MAG: putative methyltransferase [bacterium ADurb.Bin236]|nr:MAG: putative methyltransferase [bacterium ADurb.Bin236]HOY61858.1 DNA methyltransferase [bacterium]HPN95211.1 DNA methyltransferase [bacterium]
MSRRKKAASKITHRVIIGDARSMGEVEQETAHLAVASPPAWKPSATSHPGGTAGMRKFEDYAASLALTWRECHRILKPGCRLCVRVCPEIVDAATGNKQNVSLRALIEDACAKAGFKFESEIVRLRESGHEPPAPPAAPESPLPRSGSIAVRHDSILIFVKPGECPPPESVPASRSALSEREWRRLFNSLWTFPDDRISKSPEEMPEEIPRRLIRMYTFLGETVLDPFLGSGVTMVAARDTGRASIGYETDEKLKPVIQERVSGGQTMKQLSFESQNRPKRSVIEKEMKSVSGASEKPAAATSVDAGAKPATTRKRTKKQTTKEAAAPPAVVREIFGLDTLKLEDGREIRLLGLQTPAAFYSRNRGVYRQALSFVAMLLSGKSVSLRRPDSSKLHNAPGNAFHIVAPDGSNAAEALIGNGYGLCDRSVDHDLKNKFEGLESEARKQSMGIWALMKTDSPRKDS